MTSLDHFGPDWQKVKYQSHGYYSVFGVFSSKEEMELSIEKLRDSGFSREDISFVIPDRLENPHAHEHSQGKEGAAAGVATGAVLGGTLGWNRRFLHYRCRSLSRSRPGPCRSDRSRHRRNSGRNQRGPYRLRDS